VPTFPRIFNGISTAFFQDFNGKPCINRVDDFDR
jgi:hypothetical protein